jgi:hypothetical protein
VSIEAEVKFFCSLWGFSMTYFGWGGRLWVNVGGEDDSWMIVKAVGGLEDVRSCDGGEV